jgi:hypothetical protein
MNGRHAEVNPDRRGRTRHRRAPDVARRHHALALTPDGVPAASPDAPRPSPVVRLSDESRARYPWLPERVIAGSVWSGPRHVRVQVDASGNACSWPSTPGGLRPLRDRELGDVSGAGGKGRATFHDLPVVKVVDHASPKLFL